MGQRIALGVQQYLTMLAVRLGLDQHSAAAPAYPLETFISYPIHGYDIVAVDRDAG